MTQENEFVISVNRDPLFLRFVNRARDPPPPLPLPLYDPLLMTWIALYYIDNISLSPDWKSKFILSLHP